MTALSSQLPQDADPEQVHKGLQATAGLGPTATNLALLIAYWGEWAAFTSVVVTGVTLTAINFLFVEWYAQRHSRVVAEWIRMLANVAGICLNGHLTQWSPLVWTFVPYNMLWFYGLDRWVRPRFVVYLGGVLGFSLWDGVSRELAAAFILLGIFGYLLTEKRAALLRQMLGQVVAQREQLSMANERLKQVHQRAVAQEKLSSLGMLAAGVAHEINNPMSFVTSNVNSLYKELRQMPQLPEPLKEYVEDVLPATMEGIRRVNSTVADLRRFARGDPEAYAEYEMNTEAETALRIAHGQLNHCQVETELGEVGKLMGRPREIVQVLVSLLANAGQATPSGGVVRLSTRVTARREGEWVRVEVRDTGPGISPEALRHLFQPFFTTRPHGMGTGMGLAVAHGIVTAHGGRIEVQTEPGKGSCFIVHLPRVPPLPGQQPSSDTTLSEGSQPMA